MLYSIAFKWSTGETSYCMVAGRQILEGTEEQAIENVKYANRFFDSDHDHFIVKWTGEVLDV